MNIEEMHLGVNLKLQEIASFAYDDFLPKEIDYYLNDAITKFVESRKDAARDESVSSNPVSSEKAWESLRPLIEEVTFSSNNTPGFEETEFDEALRIDGFSGSSQKDISDFEYYLSSRTTLSDGSSGEGERVNNRYVNSETFMQKTSQNDDKPIFSEFPLMIAGDYIYISPSYELADLFGPDITNLWLLYLSTPQKVDIENGIDSDLPDHTHSDIVDNAVRLMQRDLGSSPNQGKQE